MAVEGSLYLAGPQPGNSPTLNLSFHELTILAVPPILAVALQIYLTCGFANAALR